MISPSTKWVLGFMSGTSCDGVDAALLKTNGDSVDALGPSLTLPYPPVFRSTLKNILGQSTLSLATQEIAQELTQYHIVAARHLLSSFSEPVELVGFHGQTIFHAPPQTLQIGDPLALAQALQIPVVADFRLNDVACGGQGAPLVPIYHKAISLMNSAKYSLPLVWVNIGGVANLTWIGKNGELIAGDTGPGNALLDDWVTQHRPEIGYDKDGVFSSLGKPDFSIINQWLQHPFFLKSFPKSLDRQAFHSFLSALASQSFEDGTATLLWFTALSIQKALSLLPSASSILLSGGGSHNPSLKSALQHGFSVPISVLNSPDLNGDAIEAQAFAYMAARKLRELPSSFPETTGVKIPTIAGKLYPCKMD